MAESRTQLEVLERGKLVAAPGSVQEGQVGIGGVRGDGPDAGPGQGEGLHRGLWGEGDGAAQCPSFQTDLGWRCSTEVVLGGIMGPQLIQTSAAVPSQYLPMLLIYQLDHFYILYVSEDCVNAK